jgi:hypothetical protein
LITAVGFTPLLLPTLGPVGTIGTTGVVGPTGLGWVGVVEPEPVVVVVPVEPPLDLPAPVLVDDPELLEPEPVELELPDPVDLVDPLPLELEVEDELRVVKVFPDPPISVFLPVPCAITSWLAPASNVLVPLPALMWSVPPPPTM